jgi:putative flippase GtrA
MADTRDWDKQMAKIDRQLESVSDEALLPAKTAATPAARERAVEAQRKTSTLGVFLRLTLAVALGVAMLFWPYVARCGIGLAAYLGATAVVVAAGVWSAVWTWRHRAGAGHVLSLLLIVWGIVLAAAEVLPRTGYALPDVNHPAVWACS